MVGQQVVAPGPPQLVAGRRLRAGPPLGVEGVHPAPPGQQGEAHVTRVTCEVFPRGATVPTLSARSVLGHGWTAPQTQCLAQAPYLDGAQPGPGPDRCPAGGGGGPAVAGRRAARGAEPGAGRGGCVGGRGSGRGGTCTRAG